MILPSLSQFLHFSYGPLPLKNFLPIVLPFSNNPSRILGNIFGQMGDHQDHAHDHGPHPVGGMPPGLQSLFAALLNPANMRSGDAVYSQEALDQIISNLMDQHPQSNAPGPAPPDAIASLPKKKIDEKMLGDDGKAECSVCMDDVLLGEEVVVLPCTHWFHETCAGLWLSEHNTCPICRKGIVGQTTQTSDNQRENSSSAPNSSQWRDNRDPEMPDRSSRRNEARLASIRRSGGLTPTQEETPVAQAPTRRWQVVGDRSSYSTGGERRMYESRTRSGAAHSPPLPRYHRQNSESSGRSHRSEQRSEQRVDRASRRQSMSFPSSSDSSGSSGPFAWLRSRWGDRNSREDR
jgi:E3 ubiquitin-protein ligase RNF115/126